MHNNSRREKEHAVSSKTKKANWDDTFCVGSAFLKSLLKKRQGTGRRGRLGKQLPANFRETRRYCKLKEKALDRAVGKFSWMRLWSYWKAGYVVCILCISGRQLLHATRSDQTQENIHTVLTNFRIVQQFAVSDCIRFYEMCWFVLSTTIKRHWKLVAYSKRGSELDCMDSSFFYRVWQVVNFLRGYN